MVFSIDAKAWIRILNTTFKKQQSAYFRVTIEVSKIFGDICVITSNRLEPVTESI